MPADLFIRAGAIVAERAARGSAGRDEVEAVLRRAAAQAAWILRLDLDGSKPAHRR